LLGIPTESVSYITPTKVSTESGKKEFDWNSMITIPKDEKGSYQFPDAGSTKIASLVEGSKSPVQETFTVPATIELAAVSDRVFANVASNNVTDQQLGEKIPEGMALFDQPIRHMLVPVASSDIEFGGRTIKKGERVSDELLAKGFPKNKTSLDWFTTSNTQYKKKQDKYKDLEQAYGFTSVRPTSEIIDAFTQEVSGKFDITGMKKEMEEMKRQAISQWGRLTEAQKQEAQDKIADDILQGAFKI
jgi:hypothetical protein